MANDETLGSWDGEEGSGGLFSHGMVTITDETTFGYDAGYMNGDQLCFILIGATDDPDFPEIKQLYSVGKGWSVTGSGEAVGRDTFLKSTNYWALVMSAVEHGMGDMLRARGEATDPSVWHGLKVPMKRVEYSLHGLVRDEGQRPLERLLIDGPPEGASKGKGKVAAASAKTAPKAAAAPVEDDDDATPATSSDLPAKLRMALTKVAKENPDHDEFMAAALDVPGVSGNEAAEDAISASGAGSIWAKAQG